MTLPGLLTAQAVAELVGGRLIGDGTREIRMVGSLERAGPSALTLAMSARYRNGLARTGAGAVLHPEALSGAPCGAAARIVVADPQRALLIVLPMLYPEPAHQTGVDPSAAVGAGAVVASDASVGPHAVIGAGARVGARVRIGAGAVLAEGVQVGEESVIEPNAVLYRGTRVGRRCVVQGGTIVGSAGFGFRSSAEGHIRVPHVGGCILEDEAEIGAACTIDRGTLDDTVIGRGTKLDNLIHVGHNVRIGARCLLMAGTVIGGSTMIGDGVIISGNCTLRDHLTVGNGARIGACSVVTIDVPGGREYSGYPARPHRETLRAQAAMTRLSPIVARLEHLADSGEDDDHA